MRVEAQRRVRAAARRVALTPQRHFWPLVALILLGGLVLRVLVHDFGLPWLDEPDELRIWFMGRIARGMPLETGAGTNPDAYPPLIIWLHQLAQPFAEAQGRPLAVDAVLDLRRLMLLFTTLGGVWFAMLGRRCAGALAGIIAAALWAFDADVIETMIYAIGDSLAIPLLMAVALLAARALEAPRRWRPALVSMALGLLCFLGDYRLLVAVIPGLAALLWQLWRRYRPGRRLTLLWSAAGVAVAGAAVAAILARLPDRLRELALEALGVHLWDMDGLFLLLGKSVSLIHSVTLPLLFLLLLLALRSRLAPASAPVSLPALLVAAALLVLTTWANSAIRPYGQASLDGSWPRHLLPATLMLYLLLAAAVAQLLSIVREARIRRLMHLLLSAYLIFFLFLPSLRLVLDYRVLPWPVIVRNWVDDNLESSTILIYDHVRMNRWFNPTWGGIPHRVWFDWWPTDDIRDHSLDELIETHKITWALIPLPDQRHLTESEEGKALLDQMLLIREFRAPPLRREGETVLYRLWRMQHETDLRFGEHIRLSGYDLHSPDAQPGDSLEFTLYWNAASTPPENYSFFLHLVADDDPRPLAQVDGNPAVPARLTQTWDRPEETLISPRISLALPPDLPPGDYRVLLGLYNFESGARLPVRDASGADPGDAWELLRLNIAAP